MKLTVSTLDPKHPFPLEELETWMTLRGFGPHVTVTPTVNRQYTVQVDDPTLSREVHLALIGRFRLIVLDEEE